MSEPNDLIAARYRLVRPIGRGGMGTVWEARDERLGRPVALKLLHPHLGLVPAEAEVANQRAMREARIAARIHHRHAVPVFDVVEHEGRPCLVMPFLPSVPLSARLREVGSLPPLEVARIGAPVSAALAVAHEAGVVHRDVKPGNILLCDDGTPMISDFGISHAYGDATLTATGLVHGTPAFLSPEVARGVRTTYASDVFSLGATLYAAAEGSPPFGSDPNPMALLHKAALGEFPLPVRSGPLTDILLAMLATDPQARPSMKTVAEAMADVNRPAPMSAPETRPAATLPLSPASPEPAVVPVVDPSTPVQPIAAPVARPAVRPVPEWPTPPPAALHQRGQRGRAVLLPLILVLAVAVVVAAAVWGTRNGTGSAGDPVSSSTASARPTPTRTPSPSSTAISGTPTAAQLAAAITDYYALMPDNTDEGWTRLTASYQRSPSGGKQAYERFWRGIRQVSVANVVGQPPSSATASVSYVYANGGRSTERTTYGLVLEDGVLKINASRVG